MAASKTSLAATVLWLVAMAGACIHPQPGRESTMTSSALSVKQQRLAATAAFTASGDLPRRATAPSEALDLRAA